MNRELFSKEYKDKGNFINIIIALVILVALIVFVYAYASILHSGVGK